MVQGWIVSLSKLSLFVISQCSSTTWCSTSIRPYINWSYKRMAPLINTSSLSLILESYTGVQRLIQQADVGMWRWCMRKHFWSSPIPLRKNDDASKNTFDPLSTRRKTLLIRFCFWKTILIGFWKRTLLIGFHFWKKHFWSAGSKAFSHASASRDYIGLLDQTLDPRVQGSNLDHIVN